MDKLLLSTLFALMASFLTAAFSFVKLVNDKEGRITDYREEWTNSLRRTLADVATHASSIAIALADQFDIHNRLTSLKADFLAQGDGKNAKFLETEISTTEEHLTRMQDEIVTLRKSMRSAYFFAKLHFKPNDKSFALVEAKYDAIFNALGTLTDPQVNKEKIAEVRGQINLYCAEFINESRSLIKEEWERIKNGEPAYKKSKNAAKWGGALLLFLIISIAIHAAFAVYRTHQFSLASAISDQPTQRYKDQRLGSEQNLGQEKSTATPPATKPDLPTR